jgi:hypothetical protein
MSGNASRTEIAGWSIVRPDEPGRPRPAAAYIETGRTPGTPQSARPRWSWWLGGAGSVAAVLIASAVLSPGVRHQWALSLGRQAKAYTQLSFDDASAIPSTVDRGKSIPIAFTITNGEGKLTSYQYVVASGSGDKLHTLTKSTMTVAAGGSGDVRVNVQPQCTSTPCRVQISLPGQKESIHFIFAYKNGSGAKKK